MNQYAPDFANLPPVAVVRVRTRDVSNRLWRVILDDYAQQVANQQIVAGVPAERAERRAKTIVGQFAVPATIESHRYPNKYRGRDGTRKDRLFGTPHMTLVFGAGNRALLAAIEAVPSAAPSQEPPKLLRNPVGKRVERRLNLYTPPWVPKLGGHRHEEITMIAFKGSAAALVGLHRALSSRPPADQVSAFHAIKDPADAETRWAVRVMSLKRQSEESVTGIPGYAGTVALACYTGRVDTALSNIEEIPGAAGAIANAQELYDIPQEWYD